MFLRANGIAIHVRQDGPPGAPALLMLHSLGTAAAIWDAPAAALATGFRVIRPDLRGHGLTEATQGPYTMAGLAADAWALLDALGIARAHVAGISIGGMIAQAMAHAAPERVASLALVDTALAILPPQAWRDRAATVRAHGTEAIEEAVLSRWVTSGFRDTPDAAGLRAMLRRTPPEGYAAAAEAIAAADLADATRRLRLPALVVVGEHDEATPVASAEALRDAIPGARLVVLPGAAHIPTVEQPEAVTEALRGFLAVPAADPYEAGLAVRRAVLGEAHVARAVAAADAFDRDFQAHITRTAWGEVWTRPHLDRRTRSLLTLAILAALGHREEFCLHVRATPNTGANPRDIAEMLLHVSTYAGVPAANSAMRLAKETLQEMRA